MSNKRYKPTLTLCVPTLNEEDNIDILYSKFTDLQRALKNRVYVKLQFTDNNSWDDTWIKIVQLTAKDDNVRAFRFGRNIGFQESILFNFIQANSDAVIQIDADLQDPIELVPAFVDAWLDGAKIVSGVRRERKESMYINVFRHFGYRIISKFADHPIPEDVGDFRLLDKEVVDCLRLIRTPSPYLRAVISSYGFPEKRIPYVRNLRSLGKSKFNVVSLIGLGIRGLLSHTRFVIKLYNFLSTVIVASLLIFLVWVFIRVSIGFEVPTGYFSLLFLITLLALFVTFGIAVLAYYLFKIYQVINGENRFYVEESGRG
jgi:glycosyltransferase involved in cell wall biosynthesis